MIEHGIIYPIPKVNIVKLGIIIPYRDRADNLAGSAPVLKQFGKIYVIEQKDDKPFNRGKLINIGYLKFKTEFDYFAAHDVDMIPQDMGYYHYSEFPCHLATQAQQFNYQMPYENYFGGVTLFTKNVFEQVNGFSNNFFGYGAEDDHLRNKIVSVGIPIKSRQCRFTSLPHSKLIDNALRLQNAKKLKEPIDWEDGLTSCEYETVRLTEHEHYTLLQVTL